VTAPLLATLLSAESDHDWRARSACSEVDPDLHHPEGWGKRYARQIDEAKAICRSCPVREDCDAWITEYEAGKSYYGRYSIWAAKTPEERFNQDRDALAKHLDWDRPHPTGRQIDPQLLEKVRNLVDVEGLSRRAIAHRLGIPETNARRAVDAVRLEQARVEYRAQQERLDQAERVAS